MRICLVGSIVRHVFVSPDWTNRMSRDVPIGGFLCSVASTSCFIEASFQVYAYFLSSSFLNL